MVGFSLFGREQETKASSETTSRTSGTKTTDEQAQRQQTETGSAQRTASEQQQQTAETTRQLLSSPVIASLETTIQDLLASVSTPAVGASAGNVASEAAEFARSLGVRAAGTGDFIDNEIGAIVSNARRQGERQLGQNVIAAQQQVGGSANSFAGLVEAIGTADLESNLARLESELALTGRQLESADLNTALQGLLQSGQLTAGAGTSEIANIAQLADVLRGAEETTVQDVTGTQQQQAAEETEVNTLIEILRELEEVQTGRSDTATFGSSSTSTGGNVLDILGLFF